MHILQPSRERVAPGCLNLVHLLPLAVVLLLFTAANLLRAQTSPATVQASYTPASPVPSSQPVTLSATVKNAGGAPVTIGSVTFYEGGVALNTVHVNLSGVATLNYLFPPSIGAYQITAHYNGSTQAAPATSPSVGLAVVQSQSVSLASSGSSAGYTLAATVNTNNSNPPGGQVTFTDTTNGQTLGTADLAGQSYTSPLNFMPSSGTEVWALGDFNGDGRIDWMSDDPQGNGVQIYLTNADGSTTQVSSNATPYGWISTVGDFNNDGMTDLVVLSSSNLLTVLLSQGNGQFSVGGQVPIVGGAAFMVVGDFNNDGNLDVLVQPDFESSSQLVFYAGDGAGNLAPGQTIDLSAQLSSPGLVADYNNDGYLDFFSTQYSFNPYAGTSLYLGAGNGTTFNEQPQSIFGSYPPPSNVESMVSGRFCNSENLDIAYVANSTLTVLCGDGTGSFNPPSNGTQFTYDVPIVTSGLAAADINADGYEDIIAFGPASEGQPNEPYAMVVFTNTGGGFSESAVASADVSAEGPSGYFFPNTPVAFSTPVVGRLLSTTTVWQNYPFFTEGTSTSATATLANVTLPPGSNNVVATYSGTQSNAVQLAGNTGGNQGPTIANLAAPNGSATVSNGVLQLTDGGTYEAGSAFSPQPVDVQSFVTTFTFQLTNAQADGFTFTVQNDSPQALGAYGGELGYGAMPGQPSIPNSVAIKFDLFNNTGEGNDSTGVYLNGANPTTPATDMTSSGVDLHSGDVMQAQIIYDGANLHLTLTDTTTNAVFQQTFPVNIPQTIGSTTAYVGFTGATGGLTATQQILSWTYEPLPYYPTFSNSPTPVLNGGASIAGTTNAALQIIDGGTMEARSAWFPNPVPIGQFATDFTFTGSNAVADGITFTIQNAGTAAVGPAGGGLGYGALSPGGPVGITNSMAIKFDLYDNNGEGNDSTGIYTNGDSPTVPAVDLSTSGIDFHSNHLIGVHIAYDGSTITMMLTDTWTNTTWSHYFYGVDLPAIVGASTAYVGFTGGTGALTATENINGWIYLPSDSISSPVRLYFGQP